MTPLEVYVYAELPQNFDIDTLMKCLKVYLQTQIQERTLESLNLINKNQIQGIVADSDIVKQGLSMFVKMYDQLKLKTSNDVWFIMIGNGNIKNMYKNVTVILLNKFPSRKECLYMVSRDTFLLTNDMTKCDKLSNLKTFTNHMNELLSTNRVMKYNNVN